MYGRATMRLGAFTVVDAYDDVRPNERLAEVPGLAEAAESAGLASVWVAEHHFHLGGVCPSPAVLLAALSGRTHRIRLGAMVSVLPFHSPIELAEEYAMVDRLSGGRLNLGLGSGYIPTEFEGFGIEPSTKRERFDAGFELLRRAFAGEPVRADGPTAHPVRLNVRPVQSPHPPLWIAVQRREAIPHVAKKQVSVALIPYATLSGRDELRDEVREYRASCPSGFHGEVAAAVHLYAGDRPDRARIALQKYLDSRRATQSTFYQEKVARDPRQASAAAVEEAGWALFGPPREVADRLREFAACGVDELLGIFDFGALPPGEVVRSVAALGKAFGSIG